MILILTYNICSFILINLFLFIILCSGWSNFTYDTDYFMLWWRGEVLVSDFQLHYFMPIGLYIKSLSALAGVIEPCLGFSLQKVSNLSFCTWALKYCFQIKSFINFSSFHVTWRHYIISFSFNFGFITSLAGICINCNLNS